MLPLLAPRSLQGCLCDLSLRMHRPVGSAICINSRRGVTRTAQPVQSSPFEARGARLVVCGCGCGCLLFFIGLDGHFFLHVRACVPALHADTCFLLRVPKPLELNVNLGGHALWHSTSHPLLALQSKPKHSSEPIRSPYYLASNTEEYCLRVRRKPGGPLSSMTPSRRMHYMPALPARHNNPSSIPIATLCVHGCHPPGPAPRVQCHPPRPQCIAHDSLAAM